MLKHLISSAAIAALIGGAAFAQESSESEQPEVEVQDPAAADPAMDQDAAAGDPAVADPAAAEQDVAQAPQLMPVNLSDLMLSDLMDAGLQSADGEQLGSIDDAKLGDGGAIENVIVSFGGFLGFGERTVEVPLEEFELMKDESGNVTAQTSMTPEAVEQLPEYQPES